VPILIGLAARYIVAGEIESLRDTGVEMLALIAGTHSPLLKPFYLQSCAGMLPHSQSLDADDAVLQEAEASGTLTNQHACDAGLHRLRGDLCAARARPRTCRYFGRRELSGSGRGTGAPGVIAVCRRRTPLSTNAQP